jgi:hypothetical protein
MTSVRNCVTRTGSRHSRLLRWRTPWMPGTKAARGYAVMRSLVMSFCAILWTGKIKTLHASIKKATAYGIDRMQRFVRSLQQTRVRSTLPSN